MTNNIHCILNKMIKISDSRCLSNNKLYLYRVNCTSVMIIIVYTIHTTNIFIHSLCFITNYNIKLKLNYNICSVYSCVHTCKFFNVPSLSQNV